MVSNHRHGALYAGVTSDLARRVREHRTGAVAGFTKRYGLKFLVWYEPHETMETAILREKQIKARNRDWKIRHIERMNPTWRDLYEDLNR
jgi:putative endonuclease